MDDNSSELLTSQYLTISDATYEDANGHRQRLMYQSSSATLFALPEASCGLLTAGRYDALTDDDFNSLVDVGAITTLSPRDERSAVIDHQRIASASRSTRRFVVVPTSYCNMGCSYCGQEHLRGSYSGPHRAAVVERMLRAIDNPDTRTLDVRWFGGEPLMAFAIIRSIASQVLPAADSAGVKFESKMATNGALLDERKLRSLHDECGLNQLEITLDGPAEIHDSHRPLKSGQKSFDKVVALIAAAAHDSSLPNLQFSIRTNVDVANADYIDELIDVMIARGMANPRIAFYFAPVHPWSNDLSASQVSRERFATREIGWLDRMADAGLTVGFFPNNPKSVVCSAVTTSAEVVNTDGQVFSCTEHPLVPAMVDKAVANIQTLQPLTLRPRGLYDDWHVELSDNQFPCSKCRFLPICGGACPKAWHDGNPPCPSYKINHQARLDLAAKTNGLTKVSE